MAQATVHPKRVKAGETFTITVTGLPKEAYVLIYDADADDPRLPELVDPVAHSLLRPAPIAGSGAVSGSQQVGTYRYEFVRSLSVKRGKLHATPALASVVVEVV